MKPRNILFVSQIQSADGSGRKARLRPTSGFIFTPISTLATTPSWVYDLFGIDSNETALEFEKNFLKSGMAVLTLFARSMKNNDNGTHSGLDFYDVWLDKDAVLAPDGTITWADLEGLEWITVWDKDPRAGKTPSKRRWSTRSTGPCTRPCTLMSR